MYQGQNCSLAEALQIICDRANVGREVARANMLAALKDGALVAEVYDSSWRGRGDLRGNPLQKHWRRPRPDEWQELRINGGVNASGVCPRNEIRLARSDVDRIWPAAAVATSAPSEDTRPAGRPKIGPTARALFASRRERRLPLNPAILEEARAIHREWPAGGPPCTDPESVARHIGDLHRAAVAADTGAPKVGDGNG